MTIPEKHIEFCRAVAQLAKDANLDRIDVTITPGFECNWRDKIQMHWWQGRHGEDAYGLAISSTVTVRAELEKGISRLAAELENPEAIKTREDAND